MVCEVGGYATWRGGVVVGPLGYLSCPRLGGFAFSYVPSIRSIARSPSRIMNFSCPPAAPILFRYVPLNIGPFVAFFLTGSFASASFLGRAPRVGFLLAYTLSFTVTLPPETALARVFSSFVGFDVFRCRCSVAFLHRLRRFFVHVRLGMTMMGTFKLLY